MVSASLFFTLFRPIALIPRQMKPCPYASASVSDHEGFCSGLSSSILMSGYVMMQSLGLWTQRISEKIFCKDVPQNVSQHLVLLKKKKFPRLFSPDLLSKELPAVRDQPSWCVSYVHCGKHEPSSLLVFGNVPYLSCLAETISVCVSVCVPIKPEIDQCTGLSPPVKLLIALQIDELRDIEWRFEVNNTWTLF